MAASQEGHVEVVDKLLQHGARPDLQLYSVTTTHKWVQNSSVIALEHTYDLQLTGGCPGCTHFIHVPIPISKWCSYLAIYSPY